MAACGPLNELRSVPGRPAAVSSAGGYGESRTRELPVLSGAMSTPTSPSAKTMAPCLASRQEDVPLSRALEREGLVLAIRRDFNEHIIGRLEKEIAALRMDVSTLRTETHQIAGTAAATVRTEISKDGGALRSHLQAEMTALRKESQAEGMALRAHLQTDVRHAIEQIEVIRQRSEHMAAEQSKSMEQCQSCMQKSVEQSQVDMQKSVEQWQAGLQTSLEKWRTDMHSQLEGNGTQTQAIIRDTLLPNLETNLQANAQYMKKICDDVEQSNHGISRVMIANTNRLVDAEQRILAAVAPVGEASTRVLSHVMELRQHLCDLQADGISQVMDAVGAVRKDVATASDAVGAVRTDVAIVTNEIRKVADSANSIVATQAYKSDVTQVLHALESRAKEAQEDRASLVAELRKVDTVALASEISKVKTEIDFSSLSAEIRALRNDTVPLLSEIRNVDLSLLTDAIDRVKSEINFTSVFREIKATRIDLAPLVAEIQKVKLDIASSMSVAIENVKSEIDFTNVFKEIRAARTDVGPMLTEIQGLKADMPLLTDEIKGAITEIDFTSVISEIKSARIHVAPLLAEIQQTKVDISPLIQAIERVKSEIDFTSVLREIRAASERTLLPDAMKSMITGIDFSSVSAEIAASRVDVTPLLSEIQKLHESNLAIVSMTTEVHEQTTTRRILERIDQLCHSADKIATETGSLGANFAKVLQATEAGQLQIMGLSRNVAAKTGLAELERRMLDLIAGIQAAVDSLPNSLATVKDKVTEVLAAVQALKVDAATRDNLTSALPAPCASIDIDTAMLQKY